ncbi:hypothetical protein [Ostreiculturibacter nitratireducens]|uniref:hypothetical protein n=1 Tax=Ostreiculturibacter nitratireducens TaxID=3075226 RepID=UPI0031B60C49
MTVHAEEPLSAIDWLSKSVADPSTPVAMPLPQPSEPDVTDGAPVDPISVTPIDAPSLDALGLLPAAMAGLPRDLWGTTPTEELARLLRDERVDTLPAIQSLLYTLLIAELDPPADADGGETLYLARVDRLLDLGALDPALALLELPDTPRPEPFRRWFDTALLLGEENRACETMRATPEVAPTFPARIFCLARGGDWNAAALSLRTGEALGYIEPEMAELLTRFLDPELFDGEPDMPPPARPSPLVFRLMEAIGQPLPTATLPVAFANSDLRSNSGWKTRIEAGERLARTGAIDPNRLLGLYTEQLPAASGGVWDRVAAIQRLDAAIADRDENAVAKTLPAAWRQMTAVELEVPFAALYGETLSALPLTGEAGRMAFRIGLLSEGYEKIARTRTPEDGIETFLIGLAQGNVTTLAPPDQLGGAIKRAFARTAAPSDEFATLLKEKRLGEAILRAIEKVTEGAKGDLREVTDGLALLRSVGLETTARRAALELMLLERRG